jgi:uncharacterized protein (TIGR03435 family)
MSLARASVCFGVWICCAVVNCQEPASNLTFEVASVKPAGPFVPGSNNRMRGGPGSDDPGRITYPRIPLVALIARAYDVGPDQVLGPRWITEEQYSVFAKIPPKTSADQFRTMLQNLLSDRFHLTLHHEARDFSVYELVVAQSGPKLKPAPPDGASSPPEASPASGSGKSRFPVLPPGSRDVTVVSDGMARSTFRMMMVEFAACLESNLLSLSSGDLFRSLGSARPRVVDRTELAGKYDFTLEFAPGAIQGSGLPLETPSDAMQGAAGPISVLPGPSLFAALDAQLGLILEKGRKASLVVIVVDHADRVPTEN